MPISHLNGTQQVSRFSDLPDDEWHRPSDWPALASIASTESKFSGLLAIYDAPSVIALSATVTGGYTVDWGDGGATENVDSGVTATHTYTYSTHPTAVTSFGYKTAVVTVTPQSANHFSGFSLQLVPTLYAIKSETGWLDIALSGPSLTTIGLATINIVTPFPAMHMNMCEAVQILSWSVTSTKYLFISMKKLQRVILPSTSTITDMSAMFNDCYSLVAPPFFDTSSVEDATTIFYDCYSLRTVPPYDWSSLNGNSQMYAYCRSLKKVPAQDWSAVTNWVNPFSYSGIQEYPSVTTGSILTSFAESEHNCPTIPSPDTSGVSAFGLTNLPQVKTANYNLRSRPFASSLTGMESLSSATFLGYRYSLNVSSCRLSSTALDALYTSLGSRNAYTITTATGNGTRVQYTTSVTHYIIVGQLVTVTGIIPSGYNVTNGLVNAVTGTTFDILKTDTGAYSSGGSIAATAAATVTVTGNHGTTGDTPSIATNKGWTVTG